MRRRLFYLAAVIVALAPRPGAAGGEEMLSGLLAEGYEIKAVTERFLIVQLAPSLLRQGAPAYLCPIDPEPERRLASLREAICEPIAR